MVAVGQVRVVRGRRPASTRPGWRGFVAWGAAGLAWPLSLACGSSGGSTPTTSAESALPAPGQSPLPGAPEPGTPGAEPANPDGELPPTAFPQAQPSAPAL